MLDLFQTKLVTATMAKVSEFGGPRTQMHKKHEGQEQASKIRWQSFQTNPLSSAVGGFMQQRVCAEGGRRLNGLAPRSPFGRVISQYLDDYK